VTGHGAQKPQSSLLHVHVCSHCTHVFRREEVEGRVHTTGLFICLRCGREGPLNIEIREMNDDESQEVTAGGIT
jgi:hypothetical protein